MTLTTAGEKALTAAYAGAETFHSSISDSVPHTSMKRIDDPINGNSPDPFALGATIVVAYR